MMADSMKKNYKISGSGVLDIKDDMITICVEDKAEFNLARVLDDFNGCAIKFSFSYDEEYEKPVEIDEETGEVI